MIMQACPAASQGLAEEAMKMIQGLNRLSYEEQAGRVEVQPGKKKRSAETLLQPLST